jgi:hypothetical protein
MKIKSQKQKKKMFNKILVEDISNIYEHLCCPLNKIQSYCLSECISEILSAIYVYVMCEINYWFVLLFLCWMLRYECL